MAKEAKKLDKTEDQLPPAGGSYIRNEDGTLVENPADSQKTPSVDNATEDISKE